MGRPFTVNEAELDWTEASHGERYAFKRKQLGAAAGGKKLGASLIELAPGKRAVPRHYHFANEEAVFVLEGEGTLRLGENEIPLRAGDYVAMPPGKDSAHQVINTSQGPLRYLAVSTMIEPDVMGYPDSDKIGVFAGAAPGGPKAQRTVDAFFRSGDRVDYYEGEE